MCVAEFTSLVFERTQFYWNTVCSEGFQVFSQFLQENADMLVKIRPSLAPLWVLYY